MQEIHAQPDDEGVIHTLDGGVKQLIEGEQLKKVDEKYEREYDYAVKSQTHLWVATTVYMLSDEAVSTMGEGPVLLDIENLLMVPLIGCFVCEEPFDSKLIHRRCKGEPR